MTGVARARRAAVASRQLGKASLDGGQRRSLG
jgi:hypothetical protein